MRLVDLGFVYGLVGVASAVAIARAEVLAANGRSVAWGKVVASAALALPLWPIWAPLSLTRAAPSPALPAPARPQDPRATRARASLDDAAASCAGTPFESLLSRETARRIADEIARAADRLAEVSSMLADPAYDRAAAASRVAGLEASGTSRRSVATARLHLENVQRLGHLRDHDARALDELGELCSALRAQLALARLSGSSAGEAGDIVAELWARIEGLDAATGAARS